MPNKLILDNEPFSKVSVAVAAMTPEHVHHVGLAWSKLVTRQLDLQAELATLAKDDMQTATRIEQEIQSLEQRIRRAERLMGGER